MHGSATQKEASVPLDPFRPSGDAFIGLAGGAQAGERSGWPHTRPDAAQLVSLLDEV